MESLAKQKDFSKQYRFMEAAEATGFLKTCLNPQVPVVKRKRQILCCNLPIHCILYSILSVPDVLFVILESFSSRLMTALGGEPNIAVHLDSLSKEGVLFTNFYANSFRTTVAGGYLEWLSCPAHY